MKNKIELDLHPITHRNAKDCTCYECTQEETKTFIKEKKDVQLEQGKERSQDKTGRLS